jgi:hypothetical protein
VCLAGDNKAYEDANNENQADDEKAEHEVPFASCSKVELDVYVKRRHKSS